MTELPDRLERLVPQPHGEGDWERVLADAARSRRRRLSLALPLAAAAAASAFLALAWPFGSEQPGGVLDRALAAIGEGPVLHIVFRGDWGPTLVDLSTGEVKPVVAESEIWYDSKRGVKYVSRLDGEVYSEHVVPPGQVVARQEEQYAALADRYRSALQSGKARIIGRGRVGGREVLWIRAHSEWLPDSADGKNHLYAEEVAVDPGSYEPVYARSTRDGRPPSGGGGAAIVELERVAAEDADFEAGSQRTRHALYGGAETLRDVPWKELARLFGEPAIWLGERHDGKPLVQTREMLFKEKEKQDDPWRTTRGATLYYGTLRPKRGGIRLREDRKPYVLLTQAKEASAMWRIAAGGVDVPEGLVRIEARGAGLLRLGSLYVSVNAKTIREVLEAAAALRPYGSPAPAPSGLDLGRIAREVDAREGHRTEAKGGQPVAPRPIVLRWGKLVQTGSSNGITVRIFSRGVVRFDLRGIDAKLKRVVPRQLSWHCFRLERGVPEGWGGSYGSVPRDGVKALPVVGHLPGGRRVPLRPPFDACELGTGFGRNWLRRFEFHGMLELPLTGRGRRYFDERAAARELGYFVRTGTRRTTRNAMRAGSPAPPAAQLRDRSHPRVAVSSSGDRFTASLTASTGRRFFVEINRGRIRRTNARGLARMYLQ